MLNIITTGNAIVHAMAIFQTKIFWSLRIIDIYKPVAEDRIALTKLMMKNIHVMMTVIGANQELSDWHLNTIFKVDQNSLRYTHKMLVGVKYFQLNQNLDLISHERAYDSNKFIFDMLSICTPGIRLVRHNKNQYFQIFFCKRGFLCVKLR